MPMGRETQIHGEWNALVGLFRIDCIWSLEYGIWRIHNDNVEAILGMGCLVSKCLKGSGAVSWRHSLSDFLMNAS